MILADSKEFKELTEEILKIGKKLRFKARGVSMHPFVKDGDTVTIEPVTDASRLKTGAIILFKNNLDKIIVHRLIKITNDDKFIAKGDSQQTNDAAIEADRILGELVTIERPGRKAINLKTPLARTKNRLIAKTSGFIMLALRLYRKTRSTVGRQLKGNTV